MGRGHGPVEELSWAGICPSLRVAWKRDSNKESTDNSTAKILQDLGTCVQVYSAQKIPNFSVWQLSDIRHPLSQISATLGTYGILRKAFPISPHPYGKHTKRRRSFSMGSGRLPLKQHVLDTHRQHQDIWESFATVREDERTSKNQLDHRNAEQKQIAKGKILASQTVLRMPNCLRDTGTRRSTGYSWNWHDTDRELAKKNT